MSVCADRVLQWRRARRKESSECVRAENTEFERLYCHGVARCLALVPPAAGAWRGTVTMDAVEWTRPFGWWRNERAGTHGEHSRLRRPRSCHRH